MPICLKCTNEFPNRKVIEGKKRNLQNRKYCLECSPFGEHNTLKIHDPKVYLIQDSRFCPCCKSDKPTDDFYSRRGKNFSSYCKPCLNQATTIRQQKLKLLAVEYKGSKCIDCGYDKCIAALEFHHLDPSTKDPSFKSSKFRSIKNMKPELDKCVLLCCRCHRERHYLKNTPGGTRTPDLEIRNFPL